MVTELAQTSFTLLVPLTAAAFLLRHGTRWFLPILAVQSVMLVLAGERTPVLAAAIALIAVLAAAGTRPSGRSLRAAAAVTVLAVLVITTARAEQGRYAAAPSLRDRLQAAVSGITTLGATQTGTPSLAAQAVTRLDGDAFTAAILQAHAWGQPYLSASYVPDSLALAVPSALWPSKLTHTTALNPVTAETDDFGLQQANFLPGVPGEYAGIRSWPWLIAFMAVLGVACGWAEQWMLSEVTPARLVMLAGAATAALKYEAGLPVILVTLRSALLIAVAVRFLEITRSRRRVAQSAPFPVPSLTPP